MADASSNNPYIRTYAKDVAVLQGKPVDTSTSAAPAVTPDAPASGGPDQTDAERDAVLARLRERAIADPIHEGNLLPETLPMPVPKADSVGELLPPVLETPIKVAPTPAAPPPPPVVIAPPPMPAPPPAPVVIPPPPVPPPAPRPQPTPQVSPALAAPAPGEQGRMHTYTSDFADRIDSKDASPFSVLAAQADSGELAPKALPAKRAHRTGPIFAAAGVLLILIAGGGAYAAYRYVASHSVVPIGPTVPSLVFADDRQMVTGEGSQLVQAIAASAEVALPDNQVRVLYLTEASTSPDGKTTTTVPLAGGRLIGALQLSAPDILLRNIATESTVGIVHAGPETRPFFILKVLSYESTFAGMLQWEGTMQSALSSFYPEYPLPPLPEPTTSTTTTIVKGKKVVTTTLVPAAPVATVAPHFVDEVTSNHDVRALKDGQGNTILLYGYKDKEMLVIARDEAAFGELLNRLAATKQQ